MGKMSDLAIELEEKKLSLEEFQQQLKDLNDAVVNFQPPKKYQSMSQSRAARDLGLLDKGIKTKRMLSGQLKHIK